MSARVKDLIRLIFRGHIAHMITMCTCVVELSDSEKFYYHDNRNTVVIFMIMNTITIVGLLNISINDTNGFLRTITVLGCILYHFMKILLVNLERFPANS